MVQKFAQLTQLVHHLHKYKYKDTAALHHPSVSGQRTVVQKAQIGKLCQKIWNMDSANEATEQLNRAERFLTEIQDNPEVITEQNIRSFLYFGPHMQRQESPGFFLDDFSQFHKFANNICLFKVKDDPEAAMNIKQAETMLGTLRWGQLTDYFLFCQMKSSFIMFKV